MGKTLQEPFLSFKENLFNDAAVTLPTAIDEEIVPATRSTALGYGWAWKIPLTNRYGNGYVYSRDFISPEQAEQELRNHLGVVAKDSPARHLTMRVGRIHNHWKKNCLAVGLSQGFIEPLEATALAIVQSTLENFVDCFDQPVSETTKESYNNYINELIDGIRDYIVIHYLLNTRTDTDYWHACREKAKPSTKLESLIACWDNQGDFMDLLFKQQCPKVYKPESWYCILAGMGRFANLRPKKANLTPTKIELTLQEKLNNIGNLYFIDHKKRLNIHS